MNVPWEKRVWLLYALFITATIALLVLPTLFFFNLGVVASISHHHVIEKLESEGTEPTVEECSGTVLSMATFIILFLFCINIAWIIACGWLLSRVTKVKRIREQVDAAEGCASADP